MHSYTYEHGSILPSDMHYSILISDIVRINGLLNNAKGIKIEYNWGYVISMDWDVVERIMNFMMPDGSKLSAQIEFEYFENATFRKGWHQHQRRRTSLFVCPVCGSKRNALYYNPFDKILYCKKDLPKTRLHDLSSVNTYYGRAKYYCKKAGGEWSTSCVCKFPEKDKEYGSINRRTNKRLNPISREEIMGLKIKFFDAQRKYFAAMIRLYHKRSRILRNKKMMAAGNG